MEVILVIAMVALVVVAVSQHRTGVGAASVGAVDSPVAPDSTAGIGNSLVSGADTAGTSNTAGTSAPASSYTSDTAPAAEDSSWLISAQQVPLDPQTAPVQSSGDTNTTTDTSTSTDTSGSLGLDGGTAGSTAGY